MMGARHPNDDRYDHSDIQPPTLLALCRRAEKLGGPEVPEREPYVPVHLRSVDMRCTNVTLPDDTYAAVLRDHAAGDVVGWLETTHAITMILWYDGEDFAWQWEIKDWSTLSTKGKETVYDGDDMVRDAAILASLSAALDLIDEENNDD